VVPAAAILPLAPALAGLLPHGGLRRGSTVLGRSSTSLLFAVLAEASTQGTWCALVGMPEVGAVVYIGVTPKHGARLCHVAGAVVDVPGAARPGRALG
jgi:ribosomal protein L2